MCHNGLVVEIFVASDAEREVQVGVVLQWRNMVNQSVMSVPLLVGQLFVFCVMNAVLASRGDGYAKTADEDCLEIFQTFYHTDSFDMIVVCGAVFICLFQTVIAACRCFGGCCFFSCWNFLSSAWSSCCQSG